MQWSSPDAFRLQISGQSVACGGSSSNSEGIMQLLWQSMARHLIGHFGYFLILSKKHLSAFSFQSKFAKL